jgi:hypothetical protein
MLELYTTPRFAAWFEALGDADAELVATAIEVLQARADGSAEEPGTSYLLWYQSAAPDVPGLEQRLQSYLLTAERTRSLVKRMQAPSVRAVYRELPKHVAHRVDDALGLLRRWAACVRIDGGHPGKALSELMSIFGEALVEAQSSAPAVLRELQLPAAAPRWRILFGVDRARGVGLLVLGEALDREHYGRAVRWALSTWERFRAGARDGVAPAHIG